MAERSATDPSAPVSSFLREHRDAVLDYWRDELAHLPSAALPAEALAPSFSQRLHDLCDVVSLLAAGEPVTLPARDRQGPPLFGPDAGATLQQTIVEYGLLRRAALRAWNAARGSPGGERLLSHAVDQAIAAWLTGYVGARERLDRGLDRIAAAGDETAGLEPQLVALTSTLLTSSEAIDAAAVVLWDEAGVRLEAAAGLVTSSAIVEAAMRQLAPQARQQPSLVRPHDGGDLGALLARAGLHWMYVVPLIGADGQAAVCVASATAPDLPEEERRLVAAAAARATAALLRARRGDLAQRSLGARHDLLGIVAHDLRNPLNAITLSATILLRGDLEARPARHVQTIRRAATRMQRLIDDLLDMARIQSSRLEISPDRQKVGEIVDAAVAAAEPLAALRSIVITRELSDPSADLWCDGERLRQVLSSLLDNAIKFSAEGDTVEVSATVDPDSARLVVRDHGAGIEPLERPHIFEPFWSAGAGSRRRTGLGLFIAQGIIEAHGGRIEVESAPGHGSTFTVVLPAAA